MLAGADVQSKIAAQFSAYERLPQVVVASGSLCSVSLDFSSANFSADFLRGRISAFCCPHVQRILSGRDPGKVTGKATVSLPYTRGSS